MMARISKLRVYWLICICKLTMRNEFQSVQSKLSQKCYFEFGPRQYLNSIQSERKSQRLLRDLRAECRGECSHFDKIVFMFVAFSLK